LEEFTTEGDAMRIIPFLLLLALPMEAQQSSSIGAQSQQDTSVPTAPYILSVSTQLVLRAVTVRDKKGKLVEDLTANDFRLTEDGKAQRVRICELQKLGGAPSDSQAQVAPGSNTASPSVHSLPTKQTGDQYYNHRLLVLYFDMTSMPVSDQLRTLSSARSFVERDMTSDDLVSILTYSGSGIRLEHAFSDDRAALLATIHSLAVGEGQGLTGGTNDASTADTGAAFGQDDAEFNIFNSDRQLAALQNVTTMFSTIREKKTLLYFASGIRLNGLDNQAQLQSTVNSAIRADVIIWPIDARGLVGIAPLGDATTASPGTLAMYTGATASAVTTNFDRSQDTFRTLAADTGGKAVLNDNDLSRGIVQAQQSVSSYYIIGYYTSNQAADGRYRSVNISLTNGLTANLEYSPGYYAKKEFKDFTATDKERQLEEALMLGDPETDISIAMELDYFRINQAEYFVPVAVKIPGSELTLAKRRGADRTIIDFIGEVKDEFGVTIANLRDKVDIGLGGSIATELSKHPISYEAGLTLLPGKYTIKFLARDGVTGRIGTYQTQFSIPNLARDTRIPLSSIVVGSQKTSTKDVIFSSKKGLNDRDNPLFDGKEKLIPSVTRVFSANKPMYVYLQAYESSDKAEPLVSVITLFSGDKRISTSSLLKPTEKIHHGMVTDEFQADLPLAQVPPGQYICQISVFAPNSHQVTFRQISFAVSP
jgi:VWFA-related protein